MLMKSLVICTVLAGALTANAQTPAPKSPEEARAQIQAQMKAQHEAQVKAQQEAQARAKAAQEQAQANAAAAAAKTNWLPGSEVAKGTVVGQSGGKDLLICRMPMPNKEIHSGKAWNNTCYVGFGGKELNMELAKGEVLSMTEPVWVPYTSGPMPPKAVVNGTSAGSPMHVCKGKVPNGETHPGKAWRNTCYVGFGGKELKLTTFEVLTVK